MSTWCKARAQLCRDRTGILEGLRDRILLQHKSSPYFPYQQSVPDSGVGCTNLVESNGLLANKGKPSRNILAS